MSHCVVRGRRVESSVKPPGCGSIAAVEHSTLPMTRSPGAPSRSTEEAITTDAHSPPNQDILCTRATPRGRLSTPMNKPAGSCHGQVFSH